MKLSEITDPMHIMIDFENINPGKIKTQAFLPGDQEIWYKPRLLIDTTENDLSNPFVITKNIIDRLFNAFGLEDNPLFDKDCRLIQKVN